MVSICFKSLSKKTIINLELLLEKSNFNNIIYTQRKFKIYYNLIIHFNGKNINNFQNNISDLFTNFIINNYEEKIIKSQLKLDFFYFAASEREEIIAKIKNKMQKEDIQNNKKIILNKIINSYIINHKKIYIDGFINFCILNYRNYLNKLLENEIHEYIIEKEYVQYIDLLRNYINEKIDNNENNTPLIHLYFSDLEKIILDKDYNIITTTTEKKYISDISFSENDFILNSILSLMPVKIIIHTNDKNNNFIIFLQEIFENRCEFCCNCEFCNNKKSNIKIINTIK